MPEPLAYLDDVPVYQAAMEVRNLAGGFRDALKIDPAVMQSGERVYFLCEAVVGDIDHARIDKEVLEAGWTRIHVLNAEAVAFVDQSLAAETLEKHKAQVALFKDEQRGQERLQHEGELKLEHTAGQHKRLKKGCPQCELEKALEESEKAAAAKKTPAKAKAEKTTVTPITKPRRTRKKTAE